MNYYYKLQIGLIKGLKERIYSKTDNAHQQRHEL